MKWDIYQLNFLSFFVKAWSQRVQMRSQVLLSSFQKELYFLYKIFCQNLQSCSLSVMYFQLLQTIRRFLIECINFLSVQSMNPMIFCMMWKSPGLVIMVSILATHSAEIKSLSYSVTSISGTFKVLKLPFQHIFGDFCIFWRLNFTKNQRFKAYETANIALFHIKMLKFQQWATVKKNNNNWIADFEVLFVWSLEG